MTYNEMLNGMSTRDKVILGTLSLATIGALYSVIIGDNHDALFRGSGFPVHETDPKDFILNSDHTPGLHTVDPNNLTEQDRIDLVRAGQGSFGQSMPPQEILDHITGHVTVMRDGGGHIIGFGATEVRGSEFYLGGIAVDQQYQGSGVAGQIMDAELKDMVRGHYEALTMRTQNELVERTTVARLNQLVASGEIKGYELQREFQPELYGRQLADGMPAPMPGGPYSQLNHARGDAFKLTFRIRY